MGKPFTIITDHKSLVTLLQSSEGICSRPAGPEVSGTVPLGALLLYQGEVTQNGQLGAVTKKWAVE